MRHHEADAPSTASITGSKRKGSSSGRCSKPCRDSLMATRVITTWTLRQSPEIASSWFSFGEMITPWSRSDFTTLPFLLSSCSPTRGRLRL
ncbi:hypothetical protein D3C75_1254860 [compost metagenome]